MALKLNITRTQEPQQNPGAMCTMAKAKPRTTIGTVARIHNRDHETTKPNAGDRDVRDMS